MPHNGKKLSLDKDCIFVQLDKRDDNGKVIEGPLSVVLNYKTGQHWTPQNDSARMVLDLLTHNYEGGKKKGITFEDMKLHLMRRYQVDDSTATQALNDFLDELEGFGLLEEKNDADGVDDFDHFQNYHPKPTNPGAERGHIEGGATLICCGSVINWTRP